MFIVFIVLIILMKKHFLRAHIRFKNIMAIS